MKYTEYKEPEFKVVKTSAEDILTASNPDTYHGGPLETSMHAIRNFGPVVGA